MGGTQRDLFCVPPRASTILLCASALKYAVPDALLEIIRLACLRPVAADSTRVECSTREAASPHQSHPTPTCPARPARAMDAPMNIPVTDLTQRPPRSVRTRLGGYALLPRMLDKCRAELAGTQGEFRFACP